MEHPDADFNNQKVIFEGMYWNKKNGDLDKLPVSASLNLVIPLGFEPKTHSLEGCCSNPTELRNHHKSGAKVGIFMCTTKFSVKNILISFVFQSFCANGYKKGSPLKTSLCGAYGTRARLAAFIAKRRKNPDRWGHKVRGTDAQKKEVLLRLPYAVRTGLEPVTSCVTGRHSNQAELTHHR